MEFKISKELEDYQNSIKDNVRRALEELSLSKPSSVIAAQTVIKVLNNER